MQSTKRSFGLYATVLLCLLGGTGLLYTAAIRPSLLTPISLGIVCYGIIAIITGIELFRVSVVGWWLGMGMYTISAIVDTIILLYNSVSSGYNILTSLILSLVVVSYLWNIQNKFNVDI